MGISSIITFLSPSLENYWGAPGPPGPSPGYGTVVACKNLVVRDMLLLIARVGDEGEVVGREKTRLKRKNGFA